MAETERACELAERRRHLALLDDAAGSRDHLRVQNLGRRPVGLAALKRAEAGPVRALQRVVDVTFLGLDPRDAQDGRQ